MNLRSRLRIGTRVRSIVRGLWPPAPKPLILMYHRIAEAPIDPWDLAVSPAHFEEQLQVLRRHRYPLGLAEFVRRLIDGTLPPHAVVLTFDDGYVDNVTAAKPRLAAADMPATVFLVTGYIDRREPFWWDELASLVYSEDGPRRFDLAIGGDTVHVDFEAEGTQRRDCSSPSDPSAKRRFMLHQIWQRLRQLRSEERDSVMADLRSILATPGHSAAMGRAMTGEDVRALVRDGLVTIGAHTVTHPVLAGLDSSTRRRELDESKLACESLVEAPVGSFAYPYGSFDASAREAVKAAGFSLACSTQATAVGAAFDLFALPRLQISNLAGDAFEQTLRLAASTP
jgi:peptidoglycan/xylan/chitin deacetylase (PgdA/CDA1 family)